MPKFRHRLGFRLESLQLGLIGKPTTPDHFDGDHPAEVFLEGLVDNPHAAACDFLDQCEIANPLDLRQFFRGAALLYC